MFDPVSYLMGKKSGGGGGGSSVANALFTLMEVGDGTITTTATAGQIAEAVDSDIYVILYREGEGEFFVVGRTGFTFSMSYTPDPDPFATITASSADATTFTLAPA